MTVLVPKESQRLHRLISFYEGPWRLTGEQGADAACVWCGRLSGPDGVDLDSISGRSCSACYLARILWLITWYDWHQHVLGCTPCQQRRTCYVGRGRRVRHELTIMPAGKRPPFCESCHCPVEADEPAMPVRWEGDSHDRLGYGHRRCVTRRAVSR
ncbi:hypothetical protein [Streptomyces murinus]|uniref:hypothetical protein n=1 Tax=Streptomyces murinus TaxID=33900 RepID=UPI003824B0EC